MRKNYTTLGKKTILILCVLLFVATYTASAQIGLPGGGDNIPDAPIDGFLSIGLIIGAALGLRKKIKGLKN